MEPMFSTREPSDVCHSHVADQSAESQNFTHQLSVGTLCHPWASLREAQTEAVKLRLDLR
jgi:hypothetical protein